jgi:hypothetical protein
MSVRSVDDTHRSGLRATDLRPSVSGGAAASAALTLLDDVPRHRLHRAALHLLSRRQGRGPSYFYHAQARSRVPLFDPTCHGSQIRMAGPG